MGIFGYLFSRATTVVYLMRHPSVPCWLKLLPVLALVYVVLPFDILRDFIPVLGYVDDVWVVIILLSIFIYLGNRYASRPPRGNGKTISTTYDVLDPPDDGDKPE